jgi:hypothetical protein
MTPGENGCTLRARGGHGHAPIGPARFCNRSTWVGRGELDMGEVIGIGVLVFGGLGAAILFLAGYISFGAPDSTLTISPGGPGPTPSCDTLCAAWNTSRTAACTALTASATAASTLAAANAALAGATATALALLAAAVAASWIPFIGPAIASALFTAYATAQAAAIFFLGRQVAAAQVAGSAATAATTALARVATSRAALVAGCTDAPTLASCLATPSPCGGVP